MPSSVVSFAYDPLGQLLAEKQHLRGWVGDKVSSSSTSTTRWATARRPCCPSLDGKGRSSITCSTARDICTR
jgi:hypothetical protein